MANGGVTTVAGYTADLQWKWPFNRNAFKLLFVFSGGSLGGGAHPAKRFAAERKIFEGESVGYLKGNIYSQYAHDTRSWPLEAQQNTGYATREAYLEHERKERWPALRMLMERCQPSLVICTGAGRRAEFADAFLGESQLDNGHEQARPGISLVHRRSATTLVVIPHLSSRAMASDASIQRVGEELRRIIAP